MYELDDNYGKAGDTLPMNPQKPLVIYHGRVCFDGLAAAWAVETSNPGQFDFHVGVYNEAPPDVTNREVYLVDFTYKRDQLLDMALLAKSITIIDHHEDNIKELKDLPRNVHVHFHAKRSGAVLAWMYFHPNTTIPHLLLHVEDNDLNKHAISGTRLIMAALASKGIFNIPPDEAFQIFDEIHHTEDNRGIHRLKVEGNIIQQARMADIQTMINETSREVEVFGHKVLVANLPKTHYHEALMVMARDRPFAMSYYDSPTHRIFSLRSTDKGLIVNEFAKRHGGNGHPHAAGFRLPHNDPQSKILVGVRA